MARNNRIEPSYFLPKDTQELMDGKAADNYALFLQRQATQIAEKGKEKFKFFYGGLLEKKFKFPKDHSNLLNELQKRQNNHLELLCSKSRVMAFKPDWRVVVGLGGESVYETSITLHHVYGIPYIPASAIKGITRMCWIRECWGYNDKAEEDALCNPLFRKVFGGSRVEKEIGKVIFFDAFPLELKESSIQVDVMNPHYPDYYTGKTEWPTDTQNPTPIYFLTVADTSFRFALGCSEHVENAEDLLKKTSCYLKKALTEFGIGAKTAVGYGRFEEDESRRKEQQQIEEEKEKKRQQAEAATKREAELS
ncbi:type III-B CRISPR module RAMP protein Cmr6 [Thioflexithrix psekupsensis]|uniref:Type III-B CRISPR module RAMP protein Cmr6 n=1 Tax=Thioflexithrix psekupsensis TaxID=1570016 RepID=A0A251X9C7_9GAMM|nr:type III-B CRISPR module RAMP protein Cmr6 [Thioflexithrix psekupsensis]OUD14535.1 type III-B CRISPR module RAMP protein Cmr6 [Thioflexithrix psekupsensis]